MLFCTRMFVFAVYDTTVRGGIRYLHLGTPKLKGSGDEIGSKAQ